MLKKGAQVDWTSKSIDAFVSIKRAIKEAPILKSPDFSKPFQIFSFASYDTIVVVMLQRMKKGLNNRSHFLASHFKGMN